MATSRALTFNPPTFIRISLPARQVQAASFVETAEVARGEPTIGIDRRGLPGRIPTERHVCPSLDATRHTGWKLPSIRTHDTDLHPGRGEPATEPSGAVSSASVR